MDDSERPRKETNSSERPRISIDDSERTHRKSRGNATDEDVRQAVESFEESTILQGYQ